MHEMTTREIQLICLDILKDVHDFCVENKIRYSLSGGSLLGAIRHNGFIPWDDDADIQMPRPDYERFIHTYKSKKGFRLFSAEVDGNLRMRFSKICETSLTFVDQGAEPFLKEDAGVCIDIFPVDGAPKTKKAAIRFIRKFKLMEQINSNRVARYASLSEIFKYRTLNRKIRFFIKHFWGYFINDNYVFKLIEFSKKFDYEKTEYFIASAHYGIGEWQPKSNMKGFMLHKFEDTELFIMSGYKENLTSLFGSNYMELPPEEKRVPHGTYRHFWKNELQ